MLKEKIINKEAKIGIIGLGYVGLPLAIEFAKAGFLVFGIDNDKTKVKKIEKGISYISDIPSSLIQEAVKSKKFRAVNDYRILKKIDVILICVPTPLTKTKDPDLTFVVQAVNKIADNLHKNQLIVLESTTYPGTTEELILKRLESKGFKVGSDFFLGFSPERIDPGNRKYNLKNTPKIVSGITKKCVDLVEDLYSNICNDIIKVSSPKVAETSKLLENIFRSVNIALVNELALLCDKMKVNVWEVIDVASTKPFGFMKFLPGPGLGGHCIPIDPFYLAWKAKEYDFRSKFIELSGEVNSYMPYHVTRKVRESLNIQGKSLKNSKVLILGVTYKKDINDVRESPALKVIELLRESKAKVILSDPFVSFVELNGEKLPCLKLSKNLLKNSDCVVIITDHSCYDPKFIVDNAKIIVDTRNLLKGFKTSKIIGL